MMIKCSTGSVLRLNLQGRMRILSTLPNLGLLEYLTDFAAKLQKKEKQQIMNYLEKLKMERNVENLKTPAVTTFEAFLDWK